VRILSELLFLIRLSILDSWWKVCLLMMVFMNVEKFCILFMVIELMLVMRLFLSCFYMFLVMNV